ncbi:hypothetical protein BKA57DRAFT_508289 [Linnemannia elongata]|nr:hypothetical protein BKA57DRAFT_508289 [Linnemannia elongata]
MFQKHPLDLHEIRSRIASSLGLKDLSYARVSQDWNDSFTPPIYNSVVLSKHDLSMESVERNKYFIKHLTIQKVTYGKLKTSAEYRAFKNARGGATVILFYHGLYDPTTPFYLLCLEAHQVTASLV